MENYEVIKLSGEIYDALVIAKNYQNPFSELAVIEKRLNKDKARILFDLMLINGTKKNRFLRHDYEKGHSSFKDYEVVRDVPQSIRKISMEFFGKHNNLVEESILPKALKFLIKMNMV